MKKFLKKTICTSLICFYFFQIEKVQAIVPYYYFPTIKNLQKQSLYIGKNAYQLLYFGQYEDSLNLAKLAVKINAKDENVFKKTIFANFNGLFSNNSSVNQLTCNEEISIMKWRASQPSGCAVPLSLQFSRKYRIGFCGDWFEGEGFARIEGSILSALKLEKKFKT